jgi:hypothetical protein
MSQENVEAVRSMYAGFSRLVRDGEDVTDLGQHVLGVARMSGRGVGSGVPIDRRIFPLWRFEGETLVQVRAFASKEEVLKAAGRSE